MNKLKAALVRIGTLLAPMLGLLVHGAQATTRPEQGGPNIAAQNAEFREALNADEASSWTLRDLALSVSASAGEEAFTLASAASYGRSQKTIKRTGGDGQKTIKHRAGGDGQKTIKHRAGGDGQKIIKHRAGGDGQKIIKHRAGGDSQLKHQRAAGEAHSRPPRSLMTVRRYNRPPYVPNKR